MKLFNFYSFSSYKINNYKPFDKAGHRLPKLELHKPERRVKLQVGAFDRYYIKYPLDYEEFGFMPLFTRDCCEIMDYHFYKPL